MAKDQAYTMPQNSTGYMKAPKITKSNAKPVTSKGKDLRSGK